MNATELYRICANALEITGPPVWASPVDPGKSDVLIFVSDQIGSGSAYWCLEPTSGHEEPDDELPVDSIMARSLIIEHLQHWLLERGWQVQADVRKDGRQRWRLADCLSIADGGGDRLDHDYPYGPSQLHVLCESVAAATA